MAQMIQSDIEYCARRIAEEERLACEAASPEAGVVHSQMAMLYKSQLAALRRSLLTCESPRPN